MQNIECFESAFQNFSLYGNLSPAVRGVLPDYAMALHSVKRAQSLALQVETHENNDLRHVFHIHELWRDVQERYPHLANAFDEENIEIMAAIHDGPEIIAQDLDNSNPIHEINRHNGRKHRLENRAFYMFIVPTLHKLDPAFCERVITVREDFERVGSSEAAFLQILDKLAGNQEIVTNYLNKNRSNISAVPKSTPEAHVARMAIKPYEYALKLSEALLPQQRLELWQFMQSIYRMVYEPTGWYDYVKIQKITQEIENRLLEQSNYAST